MEYDDSYKHAGDKPGTHWGDYEYVDHGHDQLAADPTMSEFEQDIPGLSSFAWVETIGGLQFVRSDLRSGLIQGLSMTEAQITPPQPDGVPVATAKLAPRIGPGLSTWLPEAVAAGQVVMMNVNAARAGKGEMAMTPVPDQVAVFCQPTSGYAIVDGPPEVIAQAQALVSPQPQPGPKPEPQPAAAQSSTPDWLIPVVVGGLGLAVLAVVAARR